MPAISTTTTKNHNNEAYGTVYSQLIFALLFAAKLPHADTTERPRGERWRSVETIREEEKKTTIIRARERSDSSLKLNMLHSIFTKYGK